MTKKNERLIRILVLFLLGAMIFISINIVTSAIQENLGIEALTTKPHRTKLIVLIGLAFTVAALAAKTLQKSPTIDGTESLPPSPKRSSPKPLSTDQSIAQSSIEESNIQTITGNGNKQIIGNNTGDIYAVDTLISAPTKTLPPDAKFLLPKGFNDFKKLETFTSREAELGLISERLIQNRASDSDSIVCLVGASGVGKSALACYFALSQQRKAFPGGVYGYDVGGQGKSPQSIAREFVRACGGLVEEDSQQTAQDIMREAFSSRERFLLIIDNAETVEARRLFPNLPNCSIIVTTRNRSLSGRLGIHQSNQIHLKTFSEEDALKVLAKVVGPDRINADRATAIKLTELIGNLPLALQTMGAALNYDFYKDNPLSVYLADLQQETLKSLKVGTDEDDSLDVTASFRVNLRRMEEEEKDFFASLGACGSTSFSYDTARATSDLSSSSMNRYLANLMNLSLISRASDQRDGDDYTKARYTVHTLIHEFTQTLLEERNLKSQAKWNHGNYYSDRIRTDRKSVV